MVKVNLALPRPRRRLSDNQRLALVFLLACCGVSVAVGWVAHGLWGGW